MEDNKNTVAFYVSCGEVENQFLLLQFFINCIYARQSCTEMQPPSR